MTDEPGDSVLAALRAMPYEQLVTTALYLWLGFHDAVHSPQGKIPCGYETFYDETAGDHARRNLELAEIIRQMGS